MSQDHAGEQAWTRGFALNSGDNTRQSYDAWHQTLGDREAGACRLAPWHRVVAAKLGDLSGKRVLEVGCGRGDFAIWLAQLGAQVTACDFSSAAIAIAEEKARQAGVHIDFRVEDAQAILLPDKAFDLVVSCEVLEHVPEPPRMVAELFRLCASGGRCLLTTPSYLNAVLLAWGRAWLTGRPFNSGSGVQPHENFFLFFRVVSLLQEAGFRLVDKESWHFQFLLLPRCDPARLAVPRFHRPFWNRVFQPFGLHFCYDLRKPYRFGGRI